MSVGDLIEALQKLPRHYTIEIRDEDGYLVPMEPADVTNMDKFGFKSICLG